MGLKESDPVAEGDSLDYLRAREITRLRGLIPDFGKRHNPFIRHIVRRTRDFLENTIDPSTGEPYLKPVRVELFGENTLDSLPLIKNWMKKGCIVFSHHYGFFVSVTFIK